VHVDREREARDWCPRNAQTCFAFQPDRNKIEAAVCLSVCSPSQGTPAVFAARFTAAYAVPRSRNRPPFTGKTRASVSKGARLALTGSSGASYGGRAMKTFSVKAGCATSVALVLALTVATASTRFGDDNFGLSDGLRSRRRRRRRSRHER
jgi:hypothetical protein